MDLNTTSKPPIIQNSNFDGTEFVCRPDEGEYNDAHDYFIVIGCLSLIILGTGGNIVTYKVFRQKAYKNNVMASMFRYQSVLDLIFLWTVLSQLVVKGITGYHISNVISRKCFLSAFWSEALNSLANWQLVVITLARLVHLKCPLRTQVICSKFNYNLLTVFSHIVVIAAHGIGLFLMHLRLTEEDYNSGQHCYYHIMRTDINTLAQRILYVSVNFLGPALLLVILNSMLILELRAVDQRRTRLFNKTPTSSSRHAQETTAREVTTQDETQNALLSSESFQGPQEAFSPPKRGAYNKPTHGKHRGELALQEHWTVGYPGDEDTPFDTLGEGMSVKSKPQISGHGLAHQESIHAHRILVDDGDKQRSTSVHAPTLSNGSRLFDEIKDVQDTNKLVELSNAILSKEMDVLQDSNWNQSDVPGSVVKQPSSATIAATGNNSRLNIEDPRNTRGASLAVGSEVTTLSSRASSGKRQSIRTWISDLRSHGVDMECEEDNNRELEAREDTRPTLVREQGDAVKPSKEGNKSDYSRTYTLTIMLITASAVFLLLNTPYWLLQLGAVKQVTNNASIGCSFRLFVSDIVLLLRYSNNSMNFIFYCAIGSRFRRDFLAWFCKPCRQTRM